MAKTRRGAAEVPSSASSSGRKTLVCTQGALRMNPVVSWCTKVKICICWQQYAKAPFGVYWQKYTPWWIVQMPHGKLGLFLWYRAPQQLWLEHFDHVAVRKTWKTHFRICENELGELPSQNHTRCVVLKMFVHQRSCASGPDVWMKSEG